MIMAAIQPIAGSPMVVSLAKGATCTRLEIL
jgi:hypothetical protein